MPVFQIDSNIELRPYRPDDADEIYSTVTASYEHLRPFLIWVVPEYSLDHVRTFIDESTRLAEEKQRQVYGIFVNNELAGTIAHVSFNWNARLTELGYWIAKGFEGRGIITSSVRTLINHAFDELQLNRIEIRCVTENVRSRAVPEKLGFQLEGVLRQSMWVHTRLYDLAVYGLLKDEWQQRNR